jgi:endoglucanase
MKHEFGWSVLAIAAVGAMGCTPKAGAGGTGELPGPEQAAAPCGPDAVIDDFEDNNNQVAVQAGRSGYWYTFSDDAGSTVTPAAGAKGGTFTPAEGGANGSAYAGRFAGTVGNGAVVYVGMGANMVDPKDVYDASKYGGISFFAKKGAGTGSIRLKVPDVNTDPQGNVCKECFNDHGVDLELTEAWTKYVVPYSVMRQMTGWGAPLVADIVPSKLYGIQFQVNLPGQSFDIWVDDLTFTGCQGGAGAAAAPAAPAAPAPAAPPAAPAPAAPAAPAAPVPAPAPGG